MNAAFRGGYNGGTKIKLCSACQCIIAQIITVERTNLIVILKILLEQPDFKDNKTLLQLRDCVLTVADKSSKIAISEMFTSELKFAADCLLK